MSEYSEDSLIEQTAIDLFHNQLGWDTALAYDKEFSTGVSTIGRDTKKDVILKQIFLKKLKEFNPNLPEKAYQQAYDKLIESSITKSLAEINYEKYDLLRNGISVDFTNEKGEEVKNKTLRLFDFKEAENNNFLAVQQLWIEGKSKRPRRPDIIGFVNGIPLVFIELKAAHRQVINAYEENYTDYKDTIPQLFHHNAIVILSNGIKGKIGTITAKYEYFHEWKRITEEDEGVVALDRLILGVCEKSRLMDLFENFILFDKSSGSIAKLVARNHQFIGVNKAIANIERQNQLYQNEKISFEDKQRLGVFWHTQGSGKSYSMVFLCQKIHQTFTGNYTFLIVTDRNELDNQIYGTFSGVGAIPEIKAASKKDSVQASSGKDLKSLLQSDHRYIFTLIHKFNFEEVITERDNIIVISDEAHRTQGGTLAMNMRKALPNASFIGFTGTPLFKDDELTKRIFGDYVSTYDFQRSVEDGATVPLYYENRGELLKLKNPKINEEIRNIIDTETEDLESDEREKIEQLFYKDYPILTAEKRLRTIAKDVVWHYFNQGYEGKAMFVALDKITAVKMYNFIKEELEKFILKEEKDLKNPRYGDQEFLDAKRRLNRIKETEICVVVSSEQNEIQKFQKWDLDIEPHRLKMNTQNLEERFKNEDDPFRIAIVCAMWITGFDVPSLSTLYVDKPMKSHTLMQAIARANRIHKGKNNGLIVDYIDTYENLLEALALYGTGGGEGGGEGGKPAKPKEEMIPELVQALEATEKHLKELGFDIFDLINEEDKLRKIKLIEEGLDAIYTNDETKRRFQILARIVFRKFKAIQPHKALYEYKPRRDAINVLYSSIENNVQSADVTDIIRKIQDVIDESISNMVAESHEAEGIKVDLSKLNFEIVEKYFLKSENKRAIVHSIKEMVEQRLKKMVDRNPLKVDYYKRYQEIIDAYNRGKDEHIIQETFQRLIEFINTISDEEVETKREGLTDEYKALFDILRLGKNLTTAQKKQVKNVAVQMLDELKANQLKVEYWSEKDTTLAQVYTYVSNSLFNKMPYPTYENEDLDEKTSLVIEHLKNQYWGGGESMYGRY